MTIQKKVYRSGPFKDYIAQGVRINNCLYMSGQVGIDQEGKVPVSIADQTKLVYKNMQEVLAQFGAGMSNIVDETYFVTDMDELMSNVEEVYSVREAAYGSTPEDKSNTIISSSASLSGTKNRNKVYSTSLA
jgi:enamine deaminase RidA (YjgF/YER057c/UK114 family)